MSSALVRQALEFVDSENSDSGWNKKRRTSRRAAGQGPVSDGSLPYRRVIKKKSPGQAVVKADREERNLATLLLLSQKTTDNKAASKIVERAILGKPLLDPPPSLKEEGSVLFPTEQDFEDFRKEYLNS